MCKGIISEAGGDLPSVPGLGMKARCAMGLALPQPSPARRRARPESCALVTAPLLRGAPVLTGELEGGENGLNAAYLGDMKGSR